MDRFDGKMSGPPKIDGKMTVFWSEPLNIPWTSWNLNWVCLMGTSVPLIFFLLNCYFFLGYIDTHPIPGIVHHGSLLMYFEQKMIQAKSQFNAAVILPVCLICLHALRKRFSKKEIPVWWIPLHLQSMWGVRMVLEWEVLKWMIKAIFYAF